MTNSSYLEAYQNLRDVVSHCGGNLNVHESLVKHTLKEKGITSPSTNEQKAATEKAKAAYKAMSFLCGLNKYRYQDLLNDLANAYLAGCDKYPKSLVAAYNLMTNWHSTNKQPRTKTNNCGAFNTVDDSKTNKKSQHSDGLICTRGVKCFILIVQS